MYTNLTVNNIVFANRERRRDRNCRRRVADLAIKAGLSAGAVHLLMLLLSHSDDHAKPVYGLQRRQAKMLGKCERSIRRYRAELERAGIIKTIHAPFDPILGRRAHTNVYVFIVPPARPNRRPKGRKPHHRTVYLQTAKSVQAENRALLANLQVTSSGHQLPVEQQPTVVNIKHCVKINKSHEKESEEQRPEPWKFSKSVFSDARSALR